MSIHSSFSHLWEAITHHIDRIKHAAGMSLIKRLSWVLWRHWAQQRDMLHMHFSGESNNNTARSNRKQANVKNRSDQSNYYYLELLTFEKRKSDCHFLCLYQIPVTYKLDECHSESATMKQATQISKPGACDSPVNMRWCLTELQATENKS